MRPVFKGFWCLLIFVDGIIGTVTRLFALDPHLFMMFSLQGRPDAHGKMELPFLECQQMKYGYRYMDQDGDYLFGQVFDN